MRNAEQNLDVYRPWAQGVARSNRAAPTSFFLSNSHDSRQERGESETFASVQKQARKVREGRQRLPELPERVRSLDGLRAIAVLLVIASHSFDLDWMEPAGVSFLNPGPMGVRLFFVLSGLLITGILIRARQEASSRMGVWRAFMARRALRILPAAYVVLAVAWLAGVPGMRQHGWWHVSYLSNVLFARQGDYDDGLAHFWSLAVEEQFYLLWPAVILLVPIRALPAVLAALCVASGLCRGWVASFDEFAAWHLLPTKLDALAFGGLLALVTVSPWWLVVSGAAVLGLGLTGLWPNVTSEWGLIGISAAVIVWLASRGSRFFEWSPLVALGTISYGVYLWHALWPQLFDVSRLGWWLFPAITALSILAGMLSWFCLERPLNNLKRFFPYVRHDAPIRARQPMSSPST